MKTLANVLTMNRVNTCDQRFLYKELYNKT